MTITIDLIDHFGRDPHTNSIIIYMESVGDARAFMSAAREVAISKPIIVIKPGRTEAGARAAATHTGAMTGSDEVLDAAFRRCGVLRVSSIAEMFAMAEILAKQPRPAGPRLTILTNAGGKDPEYARSSRYTARAMAASGDSKQRIWSAWARASPCSGSLRAGRAHEL